jgi:hypothetical protein
MDVHRCCSYLPPLALYNIFIFPSSLPPLALYNIFIFPSSLPPLALYSLLSSLPPSFISPSTVFIIFSMLFPPLLALYSFFSYALPLLFSFFLPLPFPTLLAHMS